MLEDFKNIRVLCIGDSMLDVFTYGRTDRVSPEAPVPVLKTIREKTMLGGAANVARNLYELGAKVTFVSVIGNDVPGRKVLELLEEHDSLEAYVLIEEQRPTTVKNRFVCGKQHMLRVDTEMTLEINEITQRKIIQILEKIASDFDVIIISDYNKGLITDKISEFLGTLPNEKLRVVNTKRDIQFYNGYSALVLNLAELEAVASTKLVDIAGIQQAVEQSVFTKDIFNCLVTMGSEGMVLLEKQYTKKQREVTKVYTANALNKNPVDVSGAGDTVLAAFALGSTNTKMSKQQIVDFASYAASIVVGKTGTATVTLEEMVNFDNSLPKVETLKDIIYRLKKQNKRVGFINGCFDMLHDGHVSLIKKAKASCDFLVVAINSDESVRNRKGPARPKFTAEIRKKMLQELRDVDYVIEFEQDTPESLIKAVLPSVIFKGVEYQTREFSERNSIRELGIDLEFINSESLTRTSLLLSEKD